MESALDLISFHSNFIIDILDLRSVFLSLRGLKRKNQCRRK